MPPDIREVMAAHIVTSRCDRSRWNRTRRRIVRGVVARIGPFAGSRGSWRRTVMSGASASNDRYSPAYPLLDEPKEVRGWCEGAELVGIRPLDFPVAARARRPAV